MSNNTEIQNKIETLMRLGLKKPVAKTLLCLSDGAERSAHQIEHEAFLRQPEVSLSVLFLFKHEYVTVRTMPHGNGKGRPAKHYRLSKPFKDILNDLVIDFRNESNTVNQSLKESFGDIGSFTS